MVGSTTFKEGQSIDLVQLREHGKIEHDGSLFRNNVHLGNNFAVNDTLVEQYLSASKDGKIMTVDDVAIVRRNRFSDSKSRDVHFQFGPKEQLLALGESALMILTLDKKGQAPPLDQIREFVQEERLPTGWTRSTREINSVDLAAYAAKLKLKAGIFSS